MPWSSCLTGANSGICPIGFAGCGAPAIAAAMPSQSVAACAAVCASWLAGASVDALLRRPSQHCLTLAAGLGPAAVEAVVVATAPPEPVPAAVVFGFGVVEGAVPVAVAVAVSTSGARFVCDATATGEEAVADVVVVVLVDEESLFGHPAQSKTRMTA